MAEQETILEAQGLTKEFKGFVAVKDVNLRVRRHTIHALIGPNGAGKTTCFNLLTKFLQPTRGRITYKGADITAQAPSDVARLRFVLAAQRDHYLPLKVIKEQLDAADRGSETTDAPSPPRGLKAVPAEGLPGPEEFADSPTRRLTQEEMLEQSGIDLAGLRELEQYGLVRPGAGGFYDTEAVDVARLVRTMAEYGIEPRHLRAFRASADREVGLLEQIVAPLYRQHGEDARGRADEALRELAALSVGLFVRIAYWTVVAGDPGPTPGDDHKVSGTSHHAIRRRRIPDPR